MRGKRVYIRVIFFYQLVVGDTRASGVVEEPPGSTTHSGSTNVPCWGMVTASVQASDFPASKKGPKSQILSHLPPIAMYLKNSQPEIRGSLGERGGLPMMSRSGGLKPRAVAGRPSVTKLTHSSWTGIRASGRPRAAVRKILLKK